MVRSFRVCYSIRLDGHYTFEAESEEEACDQLHSLADAELVGDSDLGSGQVEIYNVEDLNPPHALEQLAEAAE